MPETKLCECGCGEPAPIARATKASRGYVKGQPVRFILGHAGRGRTFTAEHRKALSASRSGPKNPAWRGGRVNGYVRLPGSRDGRRVLAHRVMMEATIGRALLRGEVVHHVNEARADNRRENLWLFPNQAAHVHWHRMQERGGDLKQPMAAVARGDGA